MSVLTVKNLHKSFGSLAILKGIDLALDAGEVVSIIGPSGSGKTTFLRCLNFLERADEGSIEFDGKTYDLRNISKKEVGAIRLRTGFVFQNYNLFLNHTVLQNVTLGLTTARHMPAKAAENKARDVLAKVNMGDRA